MISNGQQAVAQTWNDAFLSRTTDSTTIGRVGLSNALPASGSPIANTQRYINELATAVGVSGEGDASALLYANNYVIADGQNHKQSLEALDLEFHPSTGHNHDGVNSTPISAADLTDINYYRSNWSTLSVTSASGTSMDVSADFTGYTPGGGTSSIGVVTDPPYNQVEIRDSSTKTYIEDAGGQRVYGRLTWAASVWTLSFYTNEAGVETAHSLSSTNIDVYFREVFTLDNLPTFSADAGFLGSLDLVADIPYATSSLAGKVQLSSAAPPAVGTGAVGVSTNAAREDHTHDASLASGVAGAVQFSGGSGVFNSDPSNLFWDDANNRLGIGTNAPGYSLDVNGTANIGGQLTAQNILPATTNTHILGNLTYSWASANIQLLKASDGNTSLDVYGRIGKNVDGVSQFGWDGLNGIQIFDASGGGTDSVTIAVPNPLTSYTLTLPTDAGTAGYVLSTDGAGNLSWVAGGGITWSTPVDSHIIPDTNATYDIGGVASAFRDVRISRKLLNAAGDTYMDFTSGFEFFTTVSDINFNSNGTGVVNFGADRLKVFSAIGASPGTIELRKIGGGNWIAFRPDNGISSNTEYVWPTDGSSGQVLTTDGAGNLSWATPSAGVTSKKETFTLSAGDITNQYVDLLNEATVDSIFFILSKQVMEEGVDYTVNYTGGGGGVTRITFAGDLATGGAEQLVAGDEIRIQYQY